MRFVYIVGVPGAGKSRLMAEVLKGLDPMVEAGPVPHVVWYRGNEPEVVTIEKLRSSFPGTDSLGMAIMPAALAWLQRKPHPLVMAEGDRLASSKLFSAVEAAGAEVILVWLDTPHEVAAARRKARGSDQSPTWLRGRETKVANLISTRPHFRLDGTMAPESLAVSLRAHLAL